MREYDTVILRHEFEGKEQLQLSLMYTTKEYNSKDVFMARMDYMWETMQRAIKDLEPKKTYGVTYDDASKP